MKRFNKYILSTIFIFVCVFSKAQNNDVCKLNFDQNSNKIVPNIITTNGPAPSVNLTNINHIEIKHPTCGKNNGSIKVKYPINFNRKDIFISEVIDYNKGSNAYIEIYSAIKKSLNGYSLRFYNNGKLVGNAPIKGTFPLKGSIGGLGEYTQVYQVGDPNNRDFIVGNDNIVPLNVIQGFNTEDRIELLKNGVVIDTWGDDSKFMGNESKGYVWRRKSNNLLGNKNIPNYGNFMSNKDDNWDYYDDNNTVPTLSNLGKHDDFATQVEFSIDGRDWRSAISEFSNLSIGTYTIRFRYKRVPNSMFEEVEDCESTVLVELKDDTVLPNAGTDNTVSYCKGTVLEKSDAEKLIGTHDPNGTWNKNFPYTVNDNSPITYTVKSIYGCADDIATVTIHVIDPTIPIFATEYNICQGEKNPLPSESDNGIKGTWSPSFNPNKSQNYTFTPTKGQCASTVSKNVEVTVVETSKIKPL